MVKGFCMIQPHLLKSPVWLGTPGVSWTTTARYVMRRKVCYPLWALGTAALCQGFGRGSLYRRLMLNVVGVVVVVVVAIVVDVVVVVAVFMMMRVRVMRMMRMMMMMMMMMMTMMRMRMHMRTAMLWL
jgi:hypothetical protein